MSNVDFETFLQWAKDRFGEENLRIHGDEIKTHSCFADEDHKFHLWMNPSGGKSKHGERGSYRCWKTHKAGSLVSLVAHVDKCSYDEAEETICNVTSLRALEAKVHAFFNSPVENIVEQVVNQGIELPPHTFKIEDLPSFGTSKRKAENYLKSRGIPSDGLYFCNDGKYRNRIVIPYFDPDGRLIYWNARSIKDSDLRYMKPEDENLSQESVLFFLKWPKKRSKVYLTEGEFDAIVLNLCCFEAGAQGGKAITDQQINLLRYFIPVIAYDNDEGKKKDTGFEAMIENCNKLMAAGFQEIFFVRPPKGYKDWNQLYLAKGPDIVRAYIEKAEMPFNIWTEEMLRINRV